MKKKILIIIGIILVILIITGLITSHIDKGRVRNSVEPKFTIKIVSDDGNKITYWGLGYKVVRYPSVSPAEPYKNNRGVKYGSWFMNYSLDRYEEKIDYSEYAFSDVTWTRDAENDIETLRLKSDGSFAYYCSCGNPVNDSDMCESYTYDDKTKEIKFDCFETTDEMVTTVKVVKMTEDTLELDFDGEIRTFEKEE